MAPLRFCAYQYQNLPLDELTRRWSTAEQLGFDVVWNCDTMVDPDQPRHVMFDGPTTLALLATQTDRVRIGTLVTSLYFRHPVPLAKAAMTVWTISAAAGSSWPSGSEIRRPARRRWARSSRHVSRWIGSPSFSS